jgi:hypothetical protein
MHEPLAQQNNYFYIRLSSQCRSWDRLALCLHSGGRNAIKYVTDRPLLRMPLPPPPPDPAMHPHRQTGAHSLTCCSRMYRIKDR